MVDIIVIWVRATFAMDLFLQVGRSVCSFIEELTWFRFGLVLPSTDKFLMIS